MILWLDSDADESLKKQFYDIQHAKYDALLLERNQLAEENHKQTVIDEIAKCNQGTNGACR